MEGFDRKTPFETPFDSVSAQIAQVTPIIQITQSVHFDAAFFSRSMRYIPHGNLGGNGKNALCAGVGPSFGGLQLRRKSDLKFSALRGTILLTARFTAELRKGCVA